MGDLTDKELQRFMNADDADYDALVEYASALAAEVHRRRKEERIHAQERLAVESGWVELPVLKERIEHTVRQACTRSAETFGVASDIAASCATFAREATAAIVALIDPPARVTEMRLCESSRLILHAGQLYRFSVDPNCPTCVSEGKSTPPGQEHNPAGVDHEPRTIADRERVTQVIREVMATVQDLNGENYAQREIEDIATRAGILLAGRLPAITAKEQRTALQLACVALANCATMLDMNGSDADSQHAAGCRAAEQTIRAMLGGGT